MSTSNPYSKCYNRTNWYNKPSTLTPINQNNLNNNEAGTDTLDDRVVSLDINKFDVTSANPLFKDISFDETTGIFTFTRYDNSTKTIDTLLEKIVTNWYFDEQTQKLVLTLKDGTIQYVDLSAFIAEWDFQDSNTIVWTVSNHVAVASIKAHSIGSNELQTDYLADCVIAKSAAELAATSAETDALKSEGFAVGEQDGVPVTSGSPYYENNAEYYKDECENIVADLLSNYGVNVVGNTLIFGAEFTRSYTVSVVGTQLVIANAV